LVEARFDREDHARFEDEVFVIPVDFDAGVFVGLKADAVAERVCIKFFEIFFAELLSYDPV